MIVLSLPTESVGLRLYRITGRGPSERLIGCEAIRFTAGLSGVDTVLRRAAISGRVEIDGEIEDHFADVLDEDQTIVATVALDRGSYNALKNRWMRCRVEHE